MIHEFYNVFEVFVLCELCDQNIFQISKFDWCFVHTEYVSSLVIISASPL